MNTYVLRRFTPEVLRGAEHLGVSRKKLTALFGVKAQAMAELTYGLEDLNARQGRILEKTTGRSVAELAVIGIASDASPADRARHSELIQDTLEMLSHSRTATSPSSANHRANRARSKRVRSTTAKKRPNGARARAA